MGSNRVIRFRPGFLLDFDRIESDEVSLDTFSKGWIYLACIEFLGNAKQHASTRPFDAAAAKKKARVICTRATAARKALSQLSVCAHDAASHDFHLFHVLEMNAYLLSVKEAVRLTRRIEEAAASRASEPHAVGRPELYEFKDLVRELYHGFLISGGRGKITWDKRRKCYKGYPLFSIRRVLEQIWPLVPQSAVRRFLPAGNNAAGRTIAKVVRDYETEQAKKLAKKAQKNGVSAFRGIRLKEQPGDTVPA